MITCRSSAALLAACVMLAACEGGNNPLAGLNLAPSDATPPSNATAISEAQLAGGSLRLVPPEGWCIEPRSLRNVARGSFALVAGCHELTDGKKGSASPQGYITVSVGPAQLAAPDPAGLLTASLGTSAVAARDAGGGTASARLSTLGDEVQPAWRVATTAARRPILVSVYAKRGAALAGKSGGDLAEKIAQSLIASTGSKTKPVETSANAPAQPKEKLDVGGIFGRLLNRNVSE